MYSQAVVNTRVVGAMIAIQIEALCRATGASVESFHILGHSLGGHIAGYAGKRLNGTLGRITGLDPAGPYFEGLQAEARLWPTDAQFVDAIHTDASLNGMWETCGDVDFYPNGGVKQPGCLEDRLNSARQFFACDHLRGYEVYIDAINRDVTPLAHQCASYEQYKQGSCSDCGTNGCAILGPRAIEFASKNVKSNERFFLDTNSHRPLFG